MTGKLREAHAEADWLRACAEATHPREGYLMEPDELRRIADCISNLLAAPVAERGLYADPRDLAVAGDDVATSIQVLRRRDGRFTEFIGVAAPVAEPTAIQAHGFSQPMTRAEYSALLDEAIRMGEELESMIGAMSATLKANAAARRLLDKDAPEIYASDRMVVEAVLDESATETDGLKAAIDVLGRFFRFWVGSELYEASGVPVDLEEPYEAFRAIQAFCTQLTPP